VLPLVASLNSSRKAEWIVSMKMYVPEIIDTPSSTANAVIAARWRRATRLRSV
jgi:hypothetical protein